MTNPAPTPESPPASPSLPDEERVAQTLLALAGGCDPGRTVGPMEVAQALMPGDNWQRALPAVRRAAVRLALAGRLLIYRKGKVVDPSDFRGVYRLGLPREE